MLQWFVLVSHLVLSFASAETIKVPSIVFEQRYLIVKSGDTIRIEDYGQSQVTIIEKSGDGIYLHQGKTKSSIRLPLFVNFDGELEFDYETKPNWLKIGQDLLLEFESKTYQLYEPTPRRNLHLNPINCTVQ